MGRTPGAPGWFEDIPWRLGYRIRWLALSVFGPAQLDDDADPLKQLKRERERRFAVRAARRRLSH
ncbi:MAG: hypothetical protein LH630_05660 [Actinomycetia bacterium]|nr:hypothetical protein [Actinomycetes bacterium]